MCYTGKCPYESPDGECTAHGIENPCEEARKKLDKNIGLSFGRLTIIEKTNKKTGNGGQFYKCKCECGKIKDIGIRYLKRGYTLSCGCLNRENSLEKVKKMKYFEGTQIEVIKKNTIKKNNKTGVNGVYFDKRRNKYVASIKIQRVKHHLGSFTTLDEAKKAREKAEEKYFKPLIDKFNLELLEVKKEC
ncbi:AP2 domain-containing protein [Clostridium cadaveris]|uniref:AP2 domain-containing protein n=3 Tax=Clostridium cadaveris TaxID=1529 RepID=UPI0015B5E966|nr:AP2 domain-containing protein [Clostridium cadaveris]MDM8312761.1 AP2 domain-containing protein [Clostridium cadaveris]NWK12988.1 hypothetical protein [Clostridium cadaveris]